MADEEGCACTLAAGIAEWIGELGYLNERGAYKMAGLAGGIDELIAWLEAGRVHHR